MSRPIHEIEQKWQQEWEKQGIYRAKESADGEKFYGLIEFPFPSGDGLHVGHPRSYTAIDLVTRKRRMEGKNVLYPIGWDAFGLPTENFAIKKKMKPQEVTKMNVANFRRQCQSLGFGFDWSREVDTTDPKYYKWTQWQFLKFYDSWYDEALDRARPISELSIPADCQDVEAYKNEHRLAFKAKTTINWCPKDKIGLANEEAQGGVCERCGTPVEKRVKEQWMIRITKYADRLIRDLDTVDYLEKIKAQQVNWIGKSEGAFVEFGPIRVFTTRPDTLFGVTYVVLAPEHELVSQWLKDGAVENVDEVRNYIEQTAKKSDTDRTEQREKTGVVLKGIRVTNPVNHESVPVWISDYVLANYGTGAVMAVPAHDERDFEFAKKYDLLIKQVVLTSGSVAGTVVDNGELGKVQVFEDEWNDHYADDGIVMNSDFLNGLKTAEAKVAITKWLEEKGFGEKAVTYKLRDWVFSRQRYWGEPIPMIRCGKCGWVPVSTEQLPVLLPDVEEYEPTDTGESPLAKIRNWVEVKCPTCGGAAERETDTMPNWAGSSWYFLRYCDPQNDKELASQEALKYWMPVDLYNGGMEHTTLHLLYSRFWYKFLWDLGIVPKECGSEPYAKRRSHALILGEGGVKMSKSKGNVVNPDDVVKEYGADAFRVYEMFMGPYDQDAPWDTKGIEGVRRFLDRVWNLFEVKDEMAASSDLDVLFHQSIKKVTDGIDQLQFNTCISQLMILTNAYQDHGSVPNEHKETYLKILAPFAPHLSEELWSQMGKTGSIHVSAWPSYDSSKLQGSTFELVVQVNGKVRDRIEVSVDVSEGEAIRMALSSEKVQPYLEGKEVKQTKYVKGRLVSVVV